MSVINEISWSFFVELLMSFIICFCFAYYSQFKKMIVGERIKPALFTWLGLMMVSEVYYLCSILLHRIPYLNSCNGFGCTGLWIDFACTASLFFANNAGYMVYDLKNENLGTNNQQETKPSLCFFDHPKFYFAKKIFLGLVCVISFTLLFVFSYKQEEWPEASLFFGRALAFISTVIEIIYTFCYICVVWIEKKLKGLTHQFHVAQVIISVQLMIVVIYHLPEEYALMTRMVTALTGKLIIAILAVYIVRGGRRTSEKTALLANNTTQTVNRV
jgi:hypothetical protein